MNEPQYDVFIAGGGPSGSTAAFVLAGAGYRVYLAEEGRYEEDRVGESVAPAVLPILDELGLGDEFRAAKHGHSPFSRAAWDGDTLRETLLSAEAVGGEWWHLDRGRFDRWLVEVAARAGAETALGVRCERVDPGSVGWSVELAGDGGRRRVEARLLLDASGRRARLARRLGAQRLFLDRQVGVVAFPASTEADAARGSFLMVEALEAGWWYSALLPQGRLVAIFMTDTDLVRASGAALRERWLGWLDASRHTRDRLGPAQDIDLPRVHAAGNSKLDRVAGPGWLAVGDAALALDPVTGMGVWHALDSARRAAYAGSAWLEGSAEELQEYADEEESFFEEYLEVHSGIYQRNRRWPGSAYWGRRGSVSSRPRSRRP